LELNSEYEMEGQPLLTKEEIIDIEREIIETIKEQNMLNDHRNLKGFFSWLKGLAGGVWKKTRTHVKNYEPGTIPPLMPEDIAPISDPFKN
jgi:hypothetical protein